MSLLSKLHTGQAGRSRFKLSSSGDMISRHDRVRDRIFAACSTSILATVCEHKNLIPDNNSRQETYILPSWSAGQAAALDLTITSPLQRSLISDAARRCGFALNNAEERKSGHYP